MYKLTLTDKISLILVIISAINWGIIGISNINLLGIIFGTISIYFERIIYILAGVAGINLLILLIKTKVFSLNKK